MLFVYNFAALLIDTGLQFGLLCICLRVRTPKVVHLVYCFNMLATSRVRLRITTKQVNGMMKVDDIVAVVNCLCWCSVVGSLFYSYITFASKQAATTAKAAEPSTVVPVTTELQHTRTSDGYRC